MICDDLFKMTQALHGNLKPCRNINKDEYNSHGQWIFAITSRPIPDNTILIKLPIVNHLYFPSSPLIKITYS